MSSTSLPAYAAAAMVSLLSLACGGAPAPWASAPEAPPVPQDWFELAEPGRFTIRAPCKLEPAVIDRTWHCKVVGEQNVKIAYEVLDTTPDQDAARQLLLERLDEVEQEFADQRKTTRTMTLPSGHQASEYEMEMKLFGLWIDVAHREVVVGDRLYRLEVNNQVNVPSWAPTYLANFRPE